MTFFEFVFDFGSFTCASFDIESEIQTLCMWSCQYTHQGGRLRNQVVCALVYLCDE
jgi:hypothetical protein